MRVIAESPLIHLTKLGLDLSQNLQISLTKAIQSRGFTVFQ